MRKIYLAGLIAGDKLEQCQNWRNYVKRMLANFEIRNPLMDNFEFLSENHKGIVARDYRDVVESDIILANLNTFGSERSLCGTYFELAWAWEFRKPIIAISLEQVDHPFLTTCVTRFFFDNVHAVSYIQRHWQ